MNARPRQPVVHYPAELERGGDAGELIGYFHPESRQFNVVGWGDGAGSASLGRATVIGALVPTAEAETNRGETFLVGVRTANEIEFTVGGVACRKEPYDLLQNIFSRNSGILESDVMLERRAIISGCGSVGSLVALELARAGVGRFVLIDNDTMAYHNLCRHQCGVEDIGRFKVHAVRDRLQQINPSAQVVVATSVIESIGKDLFDELCVPGSIIVGCADNREGDVYASTVAMLYGIPFVSIGLWERAFAGEIFYSVPGAMPCYGCVFNEDVNNLSARVSTSRRFYTDQEDAARANFMPGISADIGFVTFVAIKMIIDLLNAGRPAYIPRVLNHLSQYTWVANTNDPRLGGERAELFAHPLQITTSLRVDYAAPCPPCKLLS